MPAPPPEPGLLDYVGVPATDVARALAFYVDVLGGATIEDARPHWARVRVANVDLGIHAVEAPPPGDARHLLGPVFRVHDIVEFRRHLEGHGVALLGDWHDIPGGVMLDFADPDGNRVGVVQYGVRREELSDAAA